VLTRDLPQPPAAPAPAPASAQAPAPAPAPAGARYSALFSRVVRRGPWELAQRSSFRSIFGTIALDLRQARLAGPDVELEIYNLFGTVTVIVPEGIAVSVEGGGLFASQVIDSPQLPPVRDAPKLLIHASGPGGTLYVRTKPPAGTLDKLVGTARAVRELHGGRGDNPAR
jgi:hypothetical protein